MLKRWGIYCKEMFPIPLHLLLGFIVFGEIYLVLLLNYGITQFNVGIQEIIVAFSLFVFLFLLRIVDDFKDYKTDLIKHPERPLPSGRVTKKDLIVLGVLVFGVTTVLNIIFMNNVIYFALAILYGAFMSVWFCYSEKLKKDFIFMMFTHTPYLLLMNVYAISFICMKYGIGEISYIVVCLAFSLYLIGFIRGVAKEIKQPKKDMAEITEVDVKNNKKYAIVVAIFAVIYTVVDIILVWNLNIFAVAILAVNLVWMLVKIKQFIKQPANVKIYNKAIIYVVVQESIVILSAVVNLISGKI